MSWKISSSPSSSLSDLSLKRSEFLDTPPPRARQVHAVLGADLLVGTRGAELHNIGLLTFATELGMSQLDKGKFFNGGFFAQFAFARNIGYFRVYMHRIHTIPDPIAERGISTMDRGVFGGQMLMSATELSQVYGGLRPIVSGSAMSSRREEEKARIRATAVATATRPPTRERREKTSLTSYRGGAGAVRLQCVTRASPPSSPSSTLKEGSQVWLVRRPIDYKQLTNLQSVCAKGVTLGAQEIVFSSRNESIEEWERLFGAFRLRAEGLQTLLESALQVVTPFHAQLAARLLLGGQANQLYSVYREAGLIREDPQTEERMRRAARTQINTIVARQNQLFETAEKKRLAEVAKLKAEKEKKGATATANATVVLNTTVAPKTTTQLPTTTPQPPTTPSISNQTVPRRRISYKKSLFTTTFGPQPLPTYRHEGGDDSRYYVCGEDFTFTFYEELFYHKLLERDKLCFEFLLNYLLTPNTKGGNSQRALSLKSTAHALGGKAYIANRTLEALLDPLLFPPRSLLLRR